MNGIQLSRLPLSGRIFCTLFLLGIGCGALAAFAQASTAVGVSPAAVQASLAPDLPMTGMQHGEPGGEKEIDLGQISSEASMTIRLVLLLSAITVTASAHVAPPIVLASDRDAITTLLPGARRHFVHEVRLTDEERQAIQMQSGWRPEEDFYRFYIGRDEQLHD